ncbi:MAG: hypothetical protein IPM54_02175 [Polyangiaceae bacterium]|nr:hypothetical protein [Polyangiaceae bacterium]
MNARIGLLASSLLSAACHVSPAPHWVPNGTAEKSYPAAPAASTFEPDAPFVRGQVVLDPEPAPLPEGAIRRLGTTRLRTAGAASCTVLTPDGSTLFVCRNIYDAPQLGMHDIDIFDVATGRFRGVVRDAPSAPIFAPDGQFGLCVSQYNRPGSIFDPRTGAIWQQVTSTQVRLAASGRRLVGTDGKNLLIYDIDAPNMPRVIATPMPAQELAVAVDGRVAAWSRDGAAGGIAVLEPDGITLKTIGTRARVRTAFLSPRPGNVVIETLVGMEIVTPTARVEVPFPPEFNVQRWPLQGHMSPDGANLFVYFYDRRDSRPMTGRLDIVAGKWFIGTPPTSGQPRFSERFAFTDEKDKETGWLAIGVHDMITGQRLGAFEDKVGSIRRTPQQTVVAFAHGNAAFLWDLKASVRLHDYHGHFGSDLFLAPSPDNRTIASMSPNDDLVYVWDLDTGAVVHRFEGQRRALDEGIAYHPNGKLLAVGSTLFDLESGRVRQRFPATPARGAAFSPDGARLAIAMDLKPPSIAVFDTASGAPVLTVPTDYEWLHEQRSHHEGKNKSMRHIVSSTLVVMP